jgi:hypothetical protein
MRQATKEEELKVVKSMLKMRLKKQNKVATEKEIDLMAKKIISEANEKIGVLEP